MDFAHLPINDLLRGEGFPCGCGKCHSVSLKYLDISPGALERLPEVLEKFGVRKPFLLCDENTYQAAGKRTEEILRLRRTGFVTFIYPQSGHIEPDETPVGRAVMALDPSCDYIFAVGSGVINDICKIISYSTGKPYIEICTAPSMDGIVSNSSSMVVDGIKSTLYTTTPVAIIADTEIMRNAPMLMLQSGLGDMLAKYISLFEWELSSIITGEYYCKEVAGLMRSALEKCVSAAHRLSERDEAAVAAMTEGLILSGIAMSFAQVSRPASGLEHYISHMYDMFSLEKGTPSSRHGIQVGIGTVLTLKLYEMIKDAKPDRLRAEAFADAFDDASWRENMRRIFGKTSGAVIGLEEKFQKNDRENHLKRLDIIIENWDRIQAMMKEQLPSCESITKLLQDVGAPIYPGEIGVSDELTRDAVIGSREIRDKYILTSLLWDIGMLDEMADRLILLISGGLT